MYLRIMCICMCICIYRERDTLYIYIYTYTHIGFDIILRNCCGSFAEAVIPPVS